MKNESVENLKDLPFATLVERLQQTIKKLESGELSLEDSLKSFEDGIQLTRMCQGHLSAAEQKVELLMKAQADGSVETQAFNPQ
jgi:exodeoxyribonuclease VII small subunit